MFPYNLWLCHTPMKIQNKEYMNIYIVQPFNHLQTDYRELTEHEYG